MKLLWNLPRECVPALSVLKLFARWGSLTVLCWGIVFALATGEAKDVSHKNIAGPVIQKSSPVTPTPTADDLPLGQSKCPGVSYAHRSSFIRKLNSNQKAILLARLTALALPSPRTQVRQRLALRSSHLLDWRGTYLGGCAMLI